MLRRTFFPLFTLAESRTMFLDPTGAPLSHPTATLAQTLQVLAEHYSRRSDGDLFLTRAALAQLMRLDVTDADSRAIAAFSVIEQTQAADPSHLTLRIMAANANDATIRERCCRCLANMCQLPTYNAVLYTNAPSGNVSNGENVPDTLVEQGAVELALGTLSMASRLSPKGRAWSALAVLNLVCLSANGAQRAAAANGETVLADFITSMTAETVTIDSGADDFGAEARVAVDAALGALVRLLTLSADDNAAGVEYRYEHAAFGTSEAIAHALHWFSVLALRDVRGAAGRRSGGSLYFPTASAAQRAAVVALLPPLHKSWSALHSLTRCGRNMSMICEGLQSSCGGAAWRGLRAALDALLVVGVELEGLAAVGAGDEARLQRAMLLSAVEALVELSATRTDVPPGLLAQAGDGASAVIPTEAAEAVAESIAAGAASSVAIATIVRIHAHGQDEDEDGDGLYEQEDFDLLTRCLLLLGNLAGQDVAVGSANALAALHALLQDALRQVTQLQEKDREALVANESREKTRLVQQCALVGLVYAALWGILRTGEGARGTYEMRLRGTVQQLQDAMESLYASVFAPEQTPSTEMMTEANEKQSESPDAAEETMRKLLPMGQQVLKGLDMAANPSGEPAQST